MSDRCRYREFGPWLTEQVGCKVQKISINAGFTCPNRDGRVGWGGCTYCNNQTFNPEYCKTEKSVSQQLEEGKRFFDRKYPSMKYLAYFQAYTNTYGELDDLRRLYVEALSVEGVVGLVIGTRPDCVDEPFMEMLSRLRDTPITEFRNVEKYVRICDEETVARPFILIEYGVESVYDKTLLRINRGHTHQQTEDAINLTKRYGFPVGVHMILGLPGESYEEWLREAEVLSDLPIDILKLHQLQLIKGTRMAEEFAERPFDFHLFAADEYVDLVVDFISHTRSDIVMERFVSQSPASLLAVPGWGLKNYEFVDKVRRRLAERDEWQGRSYSSL